ncbi:vitamin K epoxide reductase family protein [Arthrobacter sp. B1805]|uniref:vitamin K epoxide reductase family protein n=1 Tax=Arthrobacter sp. B1805 TaxID=2058892 RepID=UPI000CE4EDE2|nr:vitamin K epoxide reductase family protein [Arthrobacter sp. B1805]
MDTRRTTNASDTTDAGGPDHGRRTAGRLPIVLLVSGTIGWAASAQLVLERLALYADPDYVTTCDVSPLISCGDVFQTAQASLFGFPNPLIGIVAFAVVITTAMGLLAGARFARWYWLGLQAGVTAGLSFVAWLWFQALFVIHILCLYCIAVWAVMLVVFVAVTAHTMSTGVLQVGPRARRVAAEWSWVIALLLILAMAVSVVVSFADAFTG